LLPFPLLILSKSLERRRRKTGERKRERERDVLVGILFFKKERRKKGFVFFVRGRIQKEYVRCVFLSGVKIVRVERKRNALLLSPMKCSLSVLISFR